MKIVHLALSSPYSIGFTYHENDLPSAQAQLGMNVCVFARDSEFKNGIEVKCSNGSYKLSNGVNLIRFKTKRFFINSFTHPKSSVVLDKLKDEKPDFIWVHSITNKSLKIACKYKKINPKTIICADNHLDVNNTNINFLHRLLFAYYAFRNKKINKYIDLFYGVTPGRVDFMVKYLGVPISKSKLSLMGANFSVKEKNLDHLSCKKELLKKCNIGNQNAFLLVTGGKIDSDKKIIETIKLFKLVKNESCFLLIFGSLSEDIIDSFQKEICESKNIIFLGWANAEIATNLFVASDLGIFLGGHSTLWEKALACGLPCIFGKKEGFEHLYFGSSIFNGDFSELELTEKIEQLTTFNKEYKEMLRIGNTNKNKFDYISIAEKINKEVDLMNL